MTPSAHKEADIAHNDEQDDHDMRPQLYAHTGLGPAGIIAQLFKLCRAQQASHYSEYLPRAKERIVLRRRYSGHTDCEREPIPTLSIRNPVVGRIRSGDINHHRNVIIVLNALHHGQRIDRRTVVIGRERQPVILPQYISTILVQSQQIVKYIYTNY